MAVTVRAHDLTVGDLFKQFGHGRDPFSEVIAVEHFPGDLVLLRVRDPGAPEPRDVPPLPGRTVVLQGP